MRYGIYRIRHVAVTSEAYRGGRWLLFLIVVGDRFSVVADEGPQVRAEWEPDELIDVWTLVKGDRDLIANKAGATRLGFAVMLKFSEIEDLFPTYREEVPQAAVDYLGSLVRVEPALFAKYSWRGRTIEYHRAQIRRAYGTRPPTEDDEDRWAQWLADEMCPTETNRDRLAAALRRRCRSEKVEPPSTGQVERVVASGC